MMPLNLSQAKSILCLGAHSDDIEIGLGGTLLRWLREYPGLHVHWVVFSGSAEREREARASAALFVKNAASHKIVIGSFRDSYFPFQGAEVKGFVESIRQEVQPDIVFTHRLEDAHQDHRLLAELAWCAFRNHLILEYEIPKYEGDLGRPNVYVPLSQATVDQKVANLLAAFPTQREKPWFTPDTFTALMRIRGVECHAPERYAEAFYCRKLVI